MIKEIIEIIIILILIIINGILTMAELAIVSSRKIKLQKLEQDNVRGAKTAIKLYNDSTNFLSTVQIGITVINIILGVVGGAALSKPLAEYLSPYIPHAYPISYILIVFITTYITLVIGEIAPKQIALNDPEGISVKIAKSMDVLSRVTSPIVHLLTISTNVFLRLIGQNDAKKHEVTEEEVNLLIEEGIEEGTIEKEEQTIIQRVFRLDAQKVDMIMTPRNEIVWLDLDDSNEENQRKIIESKRSIFPVARGELDDFIGVVQAKDILGRMFDDKNSTDIHKILKNPLVIPDNLQSMELLEKFKKNKTYVHMALVVDEFGTVLGLITLNDLLEGIVGDIPGIDEMDDPKAIKIRNHSWLLDGRITIDRFKELFDINEELPNEEEDDFSTIAGFILSYLEKIPVKGEKFHWDKYYFEVLEMDGNQIDKILIDIVEPEKTEENTEDENEDKE
ncbi:MAG: hemolysin family protein [Methanobrevibacter wolinii]|uniref:hemolysin family protein n=1 Tax=Methanobrevibacter wolinii TaxID=190977 RepID=UPI0005B2AEB4|nr:hemolysin family protein [Methanobrevibacter wolinii]MDD5960470.1 hemolysin family protein [Methanobrevibacter wolinii]